MRFLLAASTALALSGAAIAADDIMANYYGNIGKSAMGQSHTHYRANHTFDSALSNDQGSMETDGTWALNDKGEICRTYNTPVPGFPNPICNAWAAHKVGDSWQITVNGRTSELTLVAGIQ
jgi:opacity protein-like surface antigen